MQSYVLTARSSTSYRSQLFNKTPSLFLFCFLKKNKTPPNPKKQERDTNEKVSLLPEVCELILWLLCRDLDFVDVWIEDSPNPDKEPIFCFNSKPESSVRLDGTGRYICLLRTKGLNTLCSPVGGNKTKLQTYIYSIISCIISLKINPFWTAVDLYFLQEWIKNCHNN